MEPDLKLILDGDKPDSHVEILVWHQVMLNASPYFRTLLSPGRFAEGEKLAREGKIEILLPETNAQAMQVLCDIFHLRHDDIPVSDMTSTMLFEIAVLADKFDCGKLLRPWSHKWVEQDHIQQELKAMQQDIGQATVQDLSKWIQICQGLGCPDVKDLFILALTQYHTVADLTRQNVVYFDHLSSSLIDSMKETQTGVMVSFHAIMLEFAELSERGDSCLVSSTQDTADSDPFDPYGNYVDYGVTDTRFHCSSITLGNFVLAARAELGSTWRSLDSWTGTIDSTYRQMQQVARHLTGPSQMSLRPMHRHSKKSTRWPTHENCSLRKNFSERVEGVMRMFDGQTTPEPVTELVVDDNNSQFDAW